MSAARVVIVVQARMTSVRLPGKVLLPLAGAPAIVRMLERVARVPGVDRTVVAISDAPEDDALARVLEEHALPFHRGPLDDVLGRMTRAAGEADVVVRLTGDCPLIDPLLIRRHIDVHAREQPYAEYVTNALVRTQPDGLDVEVVDAEMLRRADREATSAWDREHVTPWVRRRARSVPVCQEADLSHLRWTLDERADYDFIAGVFDALYARDPAFTSTDVYRLLLERPGTLHVDDTWPLDGRGRAETLRRIATHLAAEEDAA